MGDCPAYLVRGFSFIGDDREIISVVDANQLGDRVLYELEVVRRVKGLIRTLDSFICPVVLVIEICRRQQHPNNKEIFGLGIRVEGHESEFVYPSKGTDKLIHKSVTRRRLVSTPALIEVKGIYARGDLIDLKEKLCCH